MSSDRTLPIRRRGTGGRDDFHRRHYPIDPIGVEYDVVDVDGVDPTPHLGPVAGGISYLSTISRISTTYVHDAIGVPIHLFLGIWTSHDGTIDWTRVYSTLSLLYRHPTNTQGISSKIRLDG